MQRNWPAMGTRAASLGLALAVLVGVSVQPTAVSAENKDVAATTVSLPGSPSDVVLSGDGRHAYVSMRDENQIAVVDLTTGGTVASHTITEPVGLALSHDEAYLYVALNDSTGISRIDLSDWSSTFVTLSQLGDRRTWDVAELADGVVLVTANPGSNGLSWVIRYDFATGIETRVANDDIIRGAPHIYVTDDYVYIGEGFSPNSLYKLDLSDPSMPIVLEDDHGKVSGTQTIAVSPDGSFIVTRTGLKLRSSDFAEIGRFEGGVPVISSNGETVYSLAQTDEASYELAVSTASDTSLIEQWDVPCDVRDFTYPLIMVAGSGDDFVATAHDSLCIIHGDEVTFKPLPAGGRFFDDDGSLHEAAIEAIAIEGITSGCNPPQSTGFCPNDPVTRGQMAAFLVRALGLPTAINTFSDDDGSVFEADIAKLAAAGITKGCNPPANTMFCPNQPVTRGQMAAFLTRALGYSAPAGADGFIDDDGSVFESQIDALAVAGITKGCNPPANTMFCPDQPVTRAQMATFLTRALELSTRPLTPRPATAQGTDLQIITRAVNAGCTGADGEVCVVSRSISGQFYLVTGWYVDDWSAQSAAEKADFASSAVRVEAKLNGKPITLVDWGLQIVDDVADKTYSFQFPDWLTGTHLLEIELIDTSNSYSWTVEYSVITSGPGYLQLEPAAAQLQPDAPTRLAWPQN